MSKSLESVPKLPNEFAALCPTCFAPPGCCCVTEAGQILREGHFIRGFEYLVRSYIKPEAPHPNTASPGSRTSGSAQGAPVLLEADRPS